MKYFVKGQAPIRDYGTLGRAVEEGLAKSREYEQFLQSIADQLPEETRSFVVAPWYRDPKSHQCPHDSWLIESTFSVDNTPARRLSARIVVLGAYHDKILTFQYVNVAEVQLELVTCREKNLGDWLWDEYDCVGDGLVSHAIQWQVGKPWRIVSERVLFSAVESPDRAT